MPEKPKSILGPAGETVMENVKRLREARRLTFVELSALLGRLKRPIPVLGLRRIERGERRVDADDLFALAEAFDVAPVTLLLPWEEDPDAMVKVADIVGTIPARMLWQWGLGIQPWATSTMDPEADIQRFRLDSLPPFIRFGSADVAVRKLASLEEWVFKLAMMVATGAPPHNTIVELISSDLLPLEKASTLAQIRAAFTKPVPALGGGPLNTPEELEQMIANATRLLESPDISDKRRSSLRRSIDSMRQDMDEQLAEERGEQL